MLEGGSHDAVLASYGPRVSEFTTDPSRTELGQKNRSQDDINREKIFQRDLVNLSIISTLKCVQYGSWNGSPACLIGVRFQFQTGNAQFWRFESVQILLEFTSRPETKDADQDPVVVNYGPKRLQSTVTAEDRKWHFLATLSAKAGPFELGPGLEAGVEGSYTRHFAGVVECDDYGNRKHRKPNCVKISVRENSKEKEGVLRELNVAMVVEFNSPAQAALSIRADNIFHVLAIPWTKDDPIMLQPGVEFGEKVREGEANIDFASLTQDEWRQMVTPDLMLRLAVPSD